MDLIIKKQTNPIRIPNRNLARTWFVPLPVCDHTQRVYFPPNKGGGVYFFGFYSNKQTNKLKRNRVCTSHTQCVTIVSVTKCHNFEFVTSVTRSDFFIFFSKTDLVTFWSQISQMVTNSNVTGTNLFQFLCRLK